jgi:ribosome biogenesis GTPase A
MARINLKNISKQKKKFPKVVEEVIDISDVILEVLDARFVEETRNLELETTVEALGKKLIYVFNKSDLVDKKKVENVVKGKGLFPYVFVSCKERKGGRLLRNRIKREVKNLVLPDSMERAQVGIIGYPNTGKSSLINLLSGKTSAKTGNEAGFTKGKQKIRLTSDILIIDTPGVIPQNEYSSVDKKKMIDHAKVGARSFNKVRNPELVIQRLLDVYSKELEDYFGVESNGDSELFLEGVSKKKGYLKKGGEADLDRAGRHVLREWQNGKIKV